MGESSPRKGHLKKHMLDSSEKRGMMPNQTKIGYTRKILREEREQMGHSGGPPITFSLRGRGSQ